MSEAKELRRDDLIAKLELGTIIHISNEDNNLKYRTSLVGYDQNTLITSLPSKKQIAQDQFTYSDLFPEQQSLIVRLIKCGFIYAFKSEILATQTEHCKILLSTLPDTVQARPLRQATRYPCTLQAGFVIGETKYRGAITDISLTGCLLRMKQCTNKSLLESMKANDVLSKIEIKFPFNQGTKSLDIHVKSIQNNNEGYLLVGMAFDGNQTVVTQYIDSMQLEELTEFLPLNAYS